MKRCVLLLLLLLACTKSAPGTTPLRADAPTPLQVVLLDDYASKERCDGVPPKRVEVFVDGKSLAVIDVACRTKTVMPPPQVPGPTITLAAGTHVFVAREVGVGNSVEQEIELPVILDNEDGTAELATKLPVWLSDDQLQITAPRARISFESTE